VSLKKFIVGRTPVRKSTVFSDYLAEEEEKGTYGGIVTFYKSPVEHMWTDTGPNVPHYPLLAEQWWKHISLVTTGDATPQKAMDDLAYTMDELMGRLKMPRYSPKLNPKKDREYWLSQPGAPKPERPDEEPQTMDYDEMLKQWKGQ
jgi:glycerol transport system substrate-binding protein